MSNVISFMPWDAALRRAQQRRQWFVSPGDDAGKIADVPSLEAYYIIKELGSDDVEKSAAWMSSDQMRLLIDLDVWDRDAPRIEDFLVWASHFSRAGKEPAARFFQAVDPELWQYVFFARLFYAERPDSDEAPKPEWSLDPAIQRRTFETPDGRFMLAPRPVCAVSNEPVEDEDQDAVAQAVEAIFRSEAWPELSHCLASMFARTPAESLEEAHQFRRGRLTDVAFVPNHAATLPADALDAPYDPREHVLYVDFGLPAVIAERIDAGPLRAQLAGVSEASELHQKEGHLMLLLMTCIASAGAAPGNMMAVEAQVDRIVSCVVRAVRLRGEASAQRLFSEHPVRTLFRVGLGADDAKLDASSDSS